MDAEPASGEGARDLSEEFRIGAQRVTLWCTETGLLSPFRPPYSGRICVWSLAQISFRTVLQEKFSGAAGLSFYEKYREALASGFSPCFEDRVLVGGVATHPLRRLPSPWYWSLSMHGYPVRVHRFTLSSR